MSCEKERADVLVHRVAATASSNAGGCPADPKPSVYQGISKRAVELCVTVKVILEGDAESFTPALTLEDLNSLTSSAVKRMFEQQPFPHNEPSCPPNRATGVAWQKNDITRFMLYALKCGSPHILMSDIDEESDVMRSSADSKSHPHTRCGILLSRGVLPTVEVSMMSMTPTRTGLTRHCQILKNKMEVNTGYGVVENSISRSLQRRRPHPILVVSLVTLPPEYPPRQKRERVPENERKKIERERKSIEEEYRRDHTTRVTTVNNPPP